MKYTVHAGEADLEIEIDREGIIRIDGVVADADLQPSLDPTLYSLILAHRSHELRVEPADGGFRVQLEGVTYDVVVEDERSRLLAGVAQAIGADAGELPIKSPMPGIVVDVSVKEGDSVAAGQTMVVVESMKMHNEFKAPRAGVIKAVRVEAGTKVQRNTILVTLA